MITTSPILDEQGEVAQVIHIAKDITKIKEAQMELHIAANMFNASVSDLFLVHDLEGRIIYFNEAAHNILGYTKDEFQSLKISDLGKPNDTMDFGSRIKSFLEKGEATFESYNLRKDKSVGTFEIHARVIESDGRQLIMSVARDISDRKAIEEKLRESQEKYETTFESSIDALMLLDEKGFIDCNTSTLRLFGFTSSGRFAKIVLQICRLTCSPTVHLHLNQQIAIWKRRNCIAGLLTLRVHKQTMELLTRLRCYSLEWP